MFNIIRKNDENICSVIGEKNGNVKVYIEHLFSAANTTDKQIYEKDQKKNKLFKNIINSKMRKFDDIVKEKLSRSETKPKPQKVVEKKMETEKIKSKIDIFNELDGINF